MSVTIGREFIRVNVSQGEGIGESKTALASQMQTQFKCEPILLLLSCDFVLVGLPRPARCKRISERRFQLLLPKASGNSKIQTVNFCNALVEHEHGIFRFIQSYPAPGPLFDVFQADDWFKPLTGDIKADNLKNPVEIEEVDLLAVSRPRVELKDPSPIANHFPLFKSYSMSFDASVGKAET